MMMVLVTSHGFWSVCCCSKLKRTSCRIRKPMCHFSKLNQRNLRVCTAVQQVEASDEELVTKLSIDLSKSLVLPPDFLRKLPKDLQVDMKDAAFALSCGPVHQECGKDVGDALKQLSKAWEQADTESSSEIGRVLPTLHNSFSPALGKRLLKSGRYLASTGQYANGELQQISKALIALGEAVGGGENIGESDTANSLSTRVLKFGTLQVEVNSREAFGGAAVAVLFGSLSWQLAQAVERIPETSLNYANENAFVIAASLRGALVAMGYSCAGLSAVTMLGLILLGFQLSVK